MNREIKFRAYAIGKGWIQGFNLISFHDYFTEGLDKKLQRYNSEWKLSEVHLMQFTGLKDKKGVDIYEGDICEKTNYPRKIFEVKFENGAFNVSGYNLEKLRVIGNIHQNVELLNS